MTETKLRRWPYALVGLAQMLFLGSMYAWSYFKVALGDAFPMWSQKQITLNFTLMMCVFCLGGVLAGRISGSISKQNQVRISGVLMFAGFLGVSMLPQDHPAAALVMMYLCYGGLNGLGTGIAYNAIQSSVQPWFPDRGGLVSGMLLMALGFGSLILGNVAAALSGVVGLLTTFRVFAVADLIVFVGLAGFIHMPEEGAALPPAPAPRPDEGGRDYTTGEMLRRPTFWIYFCWNICMSASGMLVINSASSICVAYGVAAVVGLLVSVFNGGGRLLTGVMVDKAGWKRTMFGLNGILVLSGVLLYFGGGSVNSGVVIAGMLLMGVVYGGGITLSATLIRRLYGNRHYAMNFSVCNLCTFPAAILGPMLSAALQDAANGGFQTTFLMVIVMGGLTLVMNCFVRKP